MRGEYDTVEDLEFRKSKSGYNRFIKVIIVTLIFIILCGLCFNLVYILSYNKIEKANEDKNASKQNSSNKIYIIEQKLRKDLEKKNSKIIK